MSVQSDFTVDANTFLEAFDQLTVCNQHANPFALAHAVRYAFDAMAARQSMQAVGADDAAARKAAFDAMVPDFDPSTNEKPSKEPLHVEVMREIDMKFHAQGFMANNPWPGSMSVQYDPLIEMLTKFGLFVQKLPVRAEKPWLVRPPVTASEIASLGAFSGLSPAERERGYVVFGDETVVPPSPRKQRADEYMRRHGPHLSSYDLVAFAEMEQG